MAATEVSSMASDASSSNTINIATSTPISLQMGPRASKLRSAMTFSLDHTLKAASHKHFKKSFPKLSESEALESARVQIIDFLKTSAEEEFDAILRHHGAVERMNAWDEAIEQAKREKAVGRETLPIERPHPSTVITASRISSKQAELERLKSMLRNLESENTTMMHILVELKDKLKDVGLGKIRDSAENVESMATHYESEVYPCPLV